MKKVQGNGFRVVGKTAMPVHVKKQKQAFSHHSRMERRVTADDQVWDKVVMDLMQEYDEAWTQLADK